MKPLSSHRIKDVTLLRGVCPTKIISRIFSLSQTWRSEALHDTGNLIYSQKVFFLWNLIDIKRLTDLIVHTKEILTFDYSFPNNQKIRTSVDIQGNIYCVFV